ncbi:PA2169 family four-helix-bundle protein [Deminuibacter soli]|uniref:PA2169 family four-helix-bundle protein n=1 Tax=Deminuibacter soli TaxID=2291815 RepID=A0A3E1NQF0_9BACT|nr:PA2169 family four-helix-bundle protein [Deminuibacter soli]RFM30152.1 PA2169 family four-helix-bundle protein [Deminuibacter soli]
MEKNTAAIEVLNDLIQINNDRIAGYEKAIKELKKKEQDNDLSTLFTAMIAESHEIRNELGQEVQALGGSMDDGTTTSGKIYRAWMDIKAIFTGNDRHAVLENCEAGEDAAQKAYTAALESDVLPAYIRQMLQEQQDALRQSHDEIKSLRNQYA